MRRRSARTPGGASLRVRAPSGDAADTGQQDLSRRRLGDAREDSTDRESPAALQTGGNSRSRPAAEEANSDARAATSSSEELLQGGELVDAPAGGDCDLQALSEACPRLATATEAPAAPEDVPAPSSGLVPASGADLATNSGVASGKGDSGALEIPAAVFKECHKAVTEFLEGMGASAAPDQLYNAVVNRLKRQRKLSLRSCLEGSALDSVVCPHAAGASLDKLERSRHSRECLLCCEPTLCAFRRVHAPPALAQTRRQGRSTRSTPPSGSPPLSPRWRSACSPRTQRALRR